MGWPGMQTRYPKALRGREQNPEEGVSRFGGSPAAMAELVLEGGEGGLGQAVFVAEAEAA